MLVSCETPITDFENKVVLVGELPLTVGKVFSIACLSAIPNQTDSPEDKLKCYALTKKASNGGTCEMNVDDLSFLKKRVGHVFNTLVYGWMCENVFT